MLRPLLVRPGTRYACFNDGLCCTDLHAFGPVTRRESRVLRSLDPRPTEHHRSLDMLVVRPSATGTCLFLEGHAPGGLCHVHAQRGAMAKPNTCRRFPFGLTETPAGGRVTTDHRCPCRTMGDRPLVTESDALEAVSDRAGRPVADTIVGPRISLDRYRRVAFSTYASLESSLLRALLAGDDPATVLDAAPMPPVNGVTWTDIAHLFRSELDGTAGGAALAWFGDALLFLFGEKPRPTRDRPWSPSFDRAEARSTPTDPRASIADWVADAIWALRWTEVATFAIARAEIATRLAVLEAIRETLVQRGVRANRAAAEAICVVELAGASDLWTRIVSAS